jgi:hypothetical protein
MEFPAGFCRADLLENGKIKPASVKIFCKSSTFIHTIIGLLKLIRLLRLRLLLLGRSRFFDASLVVLLVPIEVLLLNGVASFCGFLARHDHEDAADGGESHHDVGDADSDAVAGFFHDFLTVFGGFGERVEDFLKNEDHLPYVGGNFFSGFVFSCPHQHLKRKVSIENGRKRSWRNQGNLVQGGRVPWRN